MEHPKRWYQEKEEPIRDDIVNALLALRAHAENVNSTPQLILSVDSTYKLKEKAGIYTTKIGEWHLGFRVKPLDYAQGFFVRSVFAKLDGGLLRELNKREREQIVMAAAAVFDEWQPVDVEFISDTAFALHQPFAVMYMDERNVNIVTPSKELILSAFDPSQNKGGGE